MSRGKGFPYKEAKKPKTATKPDRRPHISIHTPYGIDEQYDFSFTFPNGKGYREHPIKWTKPEIFHLIDKWASISWGSGSLEHTKVNELAGHILTLYERQKGLCAVTGVPLFGGPGLRECGIGIDIINWAVGVKRGNIRLVSAPFALSRLYTDFDRTYDRPLRTDEFTVKQQFSDIQYVIMKHIQTRMMKDDPFKSQPVVVKFKRLSGSSDEWPRTIRNKRHRTSTGHLDPSPLRVSSDSDIAFFYCRTSPTPEKSRSEGYYKFVGNETCTLIDRHAYEHLDTTIHEFCRVKLTGDVLKLVCCASSILSSIWFGRGWRRDYDAEKEFCIADPNIDIEETVVEFAKQAYRYTISRHYNLLARKEGLVCQLNLPEPPCAITPTDGF